MNLFTKHRFAGCALICLLAITAKGQIVSFNTPITLTPATNGGFSRNQINFETGANAVTDHNTTPADPVGAVFRFSLLNNNSGRTGSMLEYADANAKLVASAGLVSNLSLGASVSAATATANAGSGEPKFNYTTTGFFAGSVGNFAVDTPGYMGFAFTTSAQTYYGWAKITVTNGSLGMTVNEWAYNSTPGEAISVGATASAIPEPSTYAALAGLVVLGTTVVVRRRRGAAATVA